MQSVLLQTPPANTPIIPLTPISKESLDAWQTAVQPRVGNWLTSSGFDAASGSICLIPSEDGSLERVLVGIDDIDDPFNLGGLADKLPAGHFKLEADWTVAQLERAMLGYCLGAYRYGKYKKTSAVASRLVANEGCSIERVLDQVEGTALVRDLVNTPAQDMMPQHLSEACASLATQFGARFSETVGEQLLKDNFPAIYTVGQASVHPPRLLNFEWGEEHHPRVALVGKGVCFDSGGLDIKAASGMRLMKKDMGGAAHALGVARMVMGAGLPVRLHVLVPTVENAISGSAYRPGDVVPTRKGLSIEIDNTDAEGRVILSDALAEACSHGPDIIIDFATLTGAARVALGTELPAMFSNNQNVADDLLAASRETRDPIWQMPLHAPYDKQIDSKIADIANSTSTPYGGAITAALFLQRFVETSIAWVHFDVMAWNTRSKPGRPEGGEAMGARAVFGFLQARYGSAT